MLALALLDVHQRPARLRPGRVVDHHRAVRNLRRERAGHERPGRAHRPPLLAEIALIMVRLLRVHPDHQHPVAGDQGRVGDLPLQ